MPSSDSGSSPKMVKSTDATNPSITAIKMSVGFTGAKLERDKGDFKTWVHVFRGFVTLNHLRGYIFEPLVRAPDRDEEPNAYRNYVENCEWRNQAPLQTKTPVPRKREDGPGHRATRKLGIVWVDLTGPSPVQSRHGHVYIMNLVDDFTNKPWSIPLRKKSDTLDELKAWERAREVETGLKVGVYRTGHDGELSGRQMEAWLRSQGTD
ncbi:hypothetical protein LshimejAT787_0101090 [Lyophyllum shimeji]|uniref:Uncharacterized protein n=1 Tax=Lyophyllum shimeji TaxID=47721 RepID=A0A9P3PD18_LYOSH|nr:hypothetical protein LshimejAT787_0101090 [Lyophyllum shimeji]